MPTFLHGGKLGDIIYSLCVIKHLGGGTLYVTNQEGLAKMEGDPFESLKPLAEAQPYIESCQWWNGEPIDYDFRDFRRCYNQRRTLLDAHCDHLGVGVDQGAPWLTAPQPLPHGRIVLSRSARYHNPAWDLIWTEICMEHWKSYFVGSREEYNQIPGRTGSLQYVGTKDLRGVANVIAGCARFIGNQSAPFAIAEGLKVPVVQETHPVIQDCIFKRPNAHHIVTYQDWQNMNKPDDFSMILALQVHPGDVYQARDLVQLLCDIEPQAREDVEFVLIARRDVNKSAVKDIVSIALSKFPKSTFLISKRRGEGWPMGCNDLWADGMDQLGGKARYSATKAECVLTFEPDCIPLRPDWIDLLKAEWKKAKAMGKKVVGHAHNEPSTHINGNAIFDISITSQHSELMGSDAQTGWDVYHGKLLLRLAMQSNLIAQKYRIQEISTDGVKALRKGNVIPALFHGIKNGHGIKAVREMMQDGSFYDRTAIADPQTMGRIKRAPKQGNGKTLISILCLNRLEATKKCLEASMVTINENTELVITDNGSTDGTHEFLIDFEKQYSWAGTFQPAPKITLIHHDENTGFIAPNNHAFSLAVQGGYEYFIALNNDTEPPAGWLDLLQEPMRQNPNVALTGPQGTCCSLKQDMHGFSGMEYEYVEGSCLCVKVDIVKQYGPLFSDYLDFIYGDDSDLSLRMREKGYEIQQAGFTMPHARGETVQKQPEVKARCELAQAKNHSVLTKRWNGYLKTRRFDTPILIKREFAIGDVLLTTPLIRAIKESFPLRPIFVNTKHTQVWENNERISGFLSEGDQQFWSQSPLRVDFDNDTTILDLNMAYENRPGMHILEAYEEVAREALPGIGKIEWKAELFPSEEDYLWVDSQIPQELKEWPLVILHGDPTDWPGKNWPHFDELFQMLTDNGTLNIIQVGTKRGERIGCATDLRGKTSLLQMAALMSRAAVFVGIDSAPLHVAQAMGCPAVGLFGVTRGRYILTHGSPAVAVESSEEIPNSGLRHKVSGQTFCKEGAECMEAITPEMILSAVERLLKK